MKDLLNWLDGKKTYGAAVLAALIVLAWRPLGWIDSEVRDVLLILVGSGGLMALRAGVEKAGSR